MRPKVLLLQETIVSYRKPVYNMIAAEVDLTIAFTIKNECTEDILFKSLSLDYIRIFGVYIIKNKFIRLCSQFDVVIFMTDLHYLSYCILPFIPRKFKVIPWTIGIRASYSKRYNLSRKKDYLDHIYGFILKKSDAVLFYMGAPTNFWSKWIDRTRVFVAHNTVEVATNKLDKHQTKNSILFIGTLYREKKIFELIDAYINVRNERNVGDFPLLEIIGRGKEYDTIKKMIKKNGLESSIRLHGPIYDENILAQFFSKSLICVSPDQAGLSVLKSMGYGVPYVTRENAITGGERLNIIDKENGLLYKNQKELECIIKDVYENPETYRAMGRMAQDYYENNATIKKMAQGVIDAIEFVAM